MSPVARAENVGSLLRPAALLEARREVADGSLAPEELRALEDEAVLQAIDLQGRAGLDVTTDGELRRGAWAQMPEVLTGFESRETGPGLVWHDAAGEVSAAAVPRFPTVVGPVRVEGRTSMEDDYAFLAAHARTRTKFCLAAPSYHRRYWSEQYSKVAYASCERYLEDVRDAERQIVERLVALGCDYIQLDAPNYGSLCDRENRERMTAQGRNLDAELEFDAHLDNSLVADLSGVTGALHICRGNGPGGLWHSSGGYGVISPALFPDLEFDSLLLEYDTDRAGDFSPLRDVRQGTVVVLGLLTTKSPALEDEQDVERRIREAASVKPLAELALSTQCGFASVAAGNPLSVADEEAKLGLVGRLARKVWGPAS
ncbi:MAG TPA: hypothetical protein VMU75_12015 [Acidimicrobiales bacterium]|nr:hypothetical protein [Acidimicrobiales bacterium]